MDTKALILGRSVDHLCKLSLANSVDHCGLGLKDEDMIFVSGTKKTTRWAVAAFQGDSFRNKEGFVSGRLGALASAEFSIRISDYLLPTDHYRTGPVSLQQEGQSSRLPIPDRAGEGPTDSEQPTNSQKPNQCIFVHYYKMKRRPFKWGREPVRAAAGPGQLPREHEDDNDSSDPPSVEFVQASTARTDDAEVMDVPLIYLFRCVNLSL